MVFVSESLPDLSRPNEEIVLKTTEKLISRAAVNDEKLMAEIKKDRTLIDGLLDIIRGIKNNLKIRLAKSEKAMLDEGDGYFVHRDGKLLGIGRVKGDEIRFIGSVRPGAGADVLRALAHAITGETVILEVASVNHKAIALYERLGFIKTTELSRWYKIK